MRICHNGNNWYATKLYNQHQEKNVIPKSSQKLHLVLNEYILLFNIIQ